jgi:hypothetical protein
MSDSLASIVRFSVTKLPKLYSLPNHGAIDTCQTLLAQRIDTTFTGGYTIPYGLADPLHIQIS